MCLSIPGKVIAIKSRIATIDIAGSTYQAGTHLTEDIHIGDLVLIHSGFIIQKLTEEEAEESLNLLREILEQDDS